LQARHVLVLLLAIAGAIPYGCHAVLSLAAGGGIQVLNLAVLERSVRAALTGQSGGLASALLFARLLLVLFAVALLLQRQLVAPVPFLVGLFALIPAAAWFGLDRAAERSRP
jgi:ATP synthase I subunit